MGVVLPLTARRPGEMMRPHVLWNEPTKLYVLWSAALPTAQTIWRNTLSGGREVGGIAVIIAYFEGSAGSHHEVGTQPPPKPPFRTTDVRTRACPGGRYEDRPETGYAIATSKTPAGSLPAPMREQPPMPFCLGRGRGKGMARCCAMVTFGEGGVAQGICAMVTPLPSSPVPGVSFA